jgi:hypothetical protein
MNELYTCDGCGDNLTEDQGTHNAKGGTLCFACYRTMNLNDAALWEDGFSATERIDEVLARGEK